MAVTSRSKHRVRTGTALLGIAFFVAACGSSGSKAASPGSSSLSKSSSSASQAPAPSASSKPPKVAKAGSGGSFCDKARSEEAARRRTPRRSRPAIPQQLEQFEEKVALRPVRPCGVVAFADQGRGRDPRHRRSEVLQRPQGRQFRFTKISPDHISALETPEFTQATDKITAYLESTCGISPSDVAHLLGETSKEPVSGRHRLLMDPRILRVVISPWAARRTAGRA